jgi:hypothetical protein
LIIIFSQIYTHPPQNGFEVCAFEVFQDLRDCAEDVDVLLHRVVSKMHDLGISARAVRRTVNTLVEEHILRFVDGERVGWYAPRFCAAWQVVSQEQEVLQAIAQDRESVVPNKR